MNDQQQKDEQAEILLNPETHNNMDQGFDMSFGLGNLQKDSGNGFDMGLDLGLDF